MDLASGNWSNIAIEHDHRNSGFSHEKMVILTIVMLVYHSVDENR